MTLSDVAIPVVGALVVIALLVWWRWVRRRTAADTGDHYDSAVIQIPGRCFRLCRDRATGLASPCHQPVVGSGAFTDHRGNVLVVEACADHQRALTDWHADSDGVRGGSAVPGRD